MSKKKNPNLLIIDNYNNDKKEEYVNIAEQNEDNFKTKNFEKFKPKNSTVSVTNILKGEESKLKKMLFSILKNEENQNTKAEKSTKNQIKNKFCNTIILSSKLKKNTKKIKLKSPRKLKKLKSKIELLDKNLTPKNIISKLSITEDMKRSLSFENSKLQKESQNTNSSTSNNQKSRNNYSSFNKNDKDCNSDVNQSSSKCLNLSPKNIVLKIYNKPSAFFNKREGKNCVDMNNSKMNELKNFCTFNNKNNEDKNASYSRSFSLKNKKNFMVDNFKISSRKKIKKYTSVSPKNIKNIKISKMNFIKSNKSINKLKLTNLKILKINKEKIKQSIIIRPDEEKNDSKHYESSRISNRKDRPRISDSLILQPKISNSKK